MRNHIALALFVILFIVSCPGDFVSDRDFLSPVEAMEPELRLSVNGEACIRTDKRYGACFHISPRSSIRIDIELLSKGELSWESSCVGSGSKLVPEAGQYSLSFSDIPKLTLCNLGISFVDTSRDIPRDSAAALGFISFISSDPDYVTLPNPSVSIGEDEIEIESSKYTKDMMLRLGDRVEYLDKTNKIAIERPKQGGVLHISAQTDITRQTHRDILIP